MKPPRLLIAHPTHLGTLFIGTTEDGRYHPIWKGEALGSYQSAENAVQAAAGGHAFTPSDGTELASLGISEDMSKWMPAGEFR